MEYFGELLNLVLQLLRTPFTVFGYTFSTFSVLVLILVFDVVCLVLHGMFNQ